MWEKFNIKTFPAETVVYRDGAYCTGLSTLPNTDIDKTYTQPVHIIYIGEITGQNGININITAPNQSVFLSVNVKNKKPAFLNIYIKNTGKNSELRGHVMLINSNQLKFDCTGQHASSDTSILVKTKILAEENSESTLSGTAIINKNCENVISDIGFTALANKSAKITFMPSQRISSVPSCADHSAAIYHGTTIQTQYLREAGLGTAEVNTTLREAFMNDFPLF